MTFAKEYTLAELMITAASEVFRHDGEVLATGIGTLPRLAASLAMRTSNKDLMMTDGEAFLVSEPYPIGSRSPGFTGHKEAWMGYSRVFDNVWSGRRHAMVSPAQIDRFAQANISCIGPDYRQPKVQLLGARGFPGNSICHKNSFLVTQHSRRVFVPLVDMVCSIGYDRERLPRGYRLSDIQIGQVITDLCIMDFAAPDYQPRLISLHPGVTKDQVRDATGFEVLMGEDVPTTASPTQFQLDHISDLDPSNLRGKVLKGNPPGERL